MSFRKDYEPIFEKFNILKPIVDILVVDILKAEKVKIKDDFGEESKQYQDFQAFSSKKTQQAITSFFRMSGSSSKSKSNSSNALELPKAQRQRKNDDNVGPL